MENSEIQTQVDATRSALDSKASESWKLWEMETLTTNQLTEDR
jgi:hypothetical protein